MRTIMMSGFLMQMPSPRSNVKGILRIIIPHQECNGQGVEVADLIPEPADITPAAVPKVYRFKVAPVAPSKVSKCG